MRTCLKRWQRLRWQRSLDFTICVTANGSFNPHAPPLEMVSTRVWIGSLALCPPSAKLADSFHEVAGACPCVADSFWKEFGFHSCLGMSLWSGMCPEDSVVGYRFCYSAKRIVTSQPVPSPRKHYVTSCCKNMKQINKCVLSAIEPSRLVSRQLVWKAVSELSQHVRFSCSGLRFAVIAS